MLVLFAIGIPVGLYYSFKIADTNFCTTYSDYSGFWRITTAVRADGGRIPFIDSSFALLLQTDEEAAKASMPNMMIQPDAEQIDETYRIKLSCSGDTIMIDDSRYHYFSGTYAIELSQHWNRKDTMIMRSDQIRMKLVSVSMRQVFENLGKSARESRQ